MPALGEIYRVARAFALREADILSCPKINEKPNHRFHEPPVPGTKRRREPRLYKLDTSAMFYDETWWVYVLRYVVTSPNS